MTDTTYDEGDHTKTVFVHFGRAYYRANVFETGLALVMVQLEFLTGVAERIRREGRETFDRGRYEADFDAFMDGQHAKTLGNLLKRVMGSRCYLPTCRRLWLRPRQSATFWHITFSGARCTARQSSRARPDD